MCGFWRILYCSILVALTVAAYSPVWNNDFVDFDDEHYIASNPHVKEGLTWSGFCWAWTIERTAYWMPLTWLSFQLDAQFFSTPTPEGEVLPSPAAFHGQNLLWHCASTLLVFAVLRRLTGREAASFLVAALFAVHPMHVESVAWAAERKDVLSVFFGILALGAYCRYVEKPTRTRYLQVFLALLLSLLAKPMLMTFPFLLLLLDYWPFCRMRIGRLAAEAGDGDRRGPLSLKSLVVEKIPFILLAAVVAVATAYARERHGVWTASASFSFTARLANALTAYGWYLTTTFYPVRLSALYLHPYEDWSPLAVLTGAALCLSLTWIAIRQAARRPWLLVGWLWFTIALFPVIGLAQGGKQAWADRFSYWPHIGLFVAVVWQLAEWLQRARLPAPLYRLVAAAVLVWLTALTYRQVTFWRNNVTLWTQVLAVSTDNDQAHQNLGRYYFNRGEREVAEYHLAEASRIQMERSKRFKP